MSPTQVHSPSTNTFDFLADTGRVLGGDWDRETGNLESSSYHISFSRRFRDGVSWEETPLYNDRISRIRDGTHDRYLSEEEFRNKLELYGDMFEEFARGEYSLQSELAERERPARPGNGGRALFPSRTDRTLMRHEIAVNIGRDGTMIRNDGRHRLALAAVAGLNEIPVRVVVRHERWQALRDRVAERVDDALEEGVPPKHVRGHVAELLAAELEEVPSGLDHPDLDIILRRRLPHREE